MNTGRELAQIARLYPHGGSTLKRPFGTSPTVGSYGPILLKIEVGGIAVSGARDGTVITVFNDAGTAFVEDSCDVLDDVRFVER